MLQPMNDNRAGAPLPVLPVAAAQPLRMLAVPGIDRVTLYWPILRDPTARAVLAEYGAGSGVDSLPAGPDTRLTFGNTHVGRAVVTFAAHARLVAAGHADPIHRA